MVLSPSTRTLIIDNAGVEGVGGEIRGALEGEGVAVRHERPADPESAQQCLRDALAETDLVVVIGGDGSVNAAACVLAGTEVPLAVYPAGTANDFARTLGLPNTPAALLRLLETGRVLDVDVGTANGHTFLNVAHIGWGALVGAEIGDAEKGRWGPLTYLIGAWRAWRDHRPFRVWLQCDETYMRLRASHVSVGNGPYFGGGMRVSPAASVTEGALTVVCLRHRPLWRVLWLGVLALFGYRPRGRDAVETEAREVHLATRRQHRVAADGEWLTVTPTAFKVHPGALRVYVP